MKKFQLDINAETECTSPPTRAILSGNWKTNENLGSPNARKM